MFSPPPRSMQNRSIFFFLPLLLKSKTWTDFFLHQWWSLVCSPCFLCFPSMMYFPTSQIYLKLSKWFLIVLESKPRLLNVAYKVLQGKNLAVLSSHFGSLYSSGKPSSLATVLAPGLSVFSIRVFFFVCHLLGGSVTYPAFSLPSFFSTFTLPL